MAAQDAVIEHPNRRKAASKLTKALVVLLLLVSAGLIAIVTVGGWGALQGAKAVPIASIVLYVAAALAIVMLIFAAIAGPAWFERDKEGFTDPALDPSLLGLVTLLIVPVQALLILAAMSGFRQAWNVEVERRPAAEGPTRAVPQAS